jgi:hypothetical protein
MPVVKTETTVKWCGSNCPHHRQSQMGGYCLEGGFYLGHVWLGDNFPYNCPIIKTKEEN